MNKKNKKLALIFTSILCGTAAVVIPTSLVINNKLNNKFEYLLLDNISNQMDSISDSSSINSYIGSYDPNGSNNASSGLNQIVDDIKDNFGSDIKINSVTTSYSAPIDGKVAINLDLKYTYSTVSNDQQTINKQIKTNIDAIEFNDASFIKQIKSLDNENFDELNNLQQSIVGMNVGVDPGDLSSVNITTNPINTPSALTAEVGDNNFTPYTLSFAFTSSNSALFYNPSESSNSSTKTYTPNYSSNYNVQNVNVLQEVNQTINLDTISNNFMNLSGIYSLFNESTSLFDSEKIINLLCNGSGLDRNIIDNVSVSSTSHNPATFNITGMNIDVTFKYPYYVKWYNDSENASVKTVKDASLNKYVATIQLTNLTTTVFDLNNASQLYTLSNDKTTITGFNSTTLNSLNNNLTLYFPANVTSIDNDAFNGNRNNPNKNIKILDMSTAVNLNSLGRGAFNSANRIKNIIIPPSVQQFNGWTFQNLHDQITIFIQGSYPNSNAKFNNTFSGATNLNIYVIDQVTKDSIFGAGGNSALSYDKVLINQQISNTNYIINNIINTSSGTSSN